MKTLITLTLALVAFNAFAINTNRTWHARGERFMFVARDTAQSGYSSKQSALQGALDLASNFQSGSLSKHAKAVIRNSRPLWDGSEKCAANKLIRLVEGEMSKGNFEVMKINIGSYFSGNGQEVFSYKMRFWTPCVKKQKD
jgi:hypothetical protein